MVIKVRYGKEEKWIERNHAPEIGTEILFDHVLVIVDRVIDCESQHETIVYATEVIKDFDL